MYLFLTFSSSTQVEIDETNTAEYKTFFRSQAKIADTIGGINGLIDRIVADLYAKKLVSKTARDAADIYGPDVTEVMRVKSVLEEILVSIKADKEMYYKIRSVLLLNITADAPGLARYLPEGIGFIKINHAHILVCKYS